MTDTHVEVDGQRLVLRNLDKPLYPSGFTKAEVIDYYTRVAPAMVPHLAGRPLTMKRYPDGSDGPFFFEKNCPSHRPEWMRTVEVGDGVSYCELDSRAGLVWVANLAALELHVPMGTAADPDGARAMVFDLDPGAPAAVGECARVALWIKEVLDQLDLVAVPKTSGSKGLQIYVPTAPGTGFDVTQPFSKALAQLLERDHPAEVVSVMDRSKRPGKVYVDWAQNHRAKTTVCVYSLRATPHPTVSTPLTWDEVATGADEPDRLRIEAPAVLDRLDEHGDLFAPVLEVDQEIPALTV